MQYTSWEKIQKGNIYKFSISFILWIMFGLIKLESLLPTPCVAWGLIWGVFETVSHFHYYRSRRLLKLYIPHSAVCHCSKWHFCAHNVCLFRIFRIWEDLQDYKNTISTWIFASLKYKIHKEQLRKLHLFSLFLQPSLARTVFLFLPGSKW